MYREEEVALLLELQQGVYVTGSHIFCRHDIGFAVVGFSTNVILIIHLENFVTVSFSEEVKVREAVFGYRYTDRFEPIFQQALVFH